MHVTAATQTIVNQFCYITSCLNVRLHIHENEIGARNIRVSTIDIQIGRNLYTFLLCA